MKGQRENMDLNIIDIALETKNIKDIINTSSINFL